MSDIAALVGDHIAIWTGAIERRLGARRGGRRGVGLYGIGRLRALILELAVSGKLVPQDASDQPAAALLKRISQVSVESPRKGRLAAAQPKDGNLPSGWRRARLAELANPQAGFAFKSGGFNEHGVGLPLIRIRDVGQPFTGTFYSGEYREEFIVSEGDYLISMDGEFRVATWPGPDALLNQRVCRLQFHGNEIVQPFVAMALQMELTKLQGVKAYTTVDHLSGKQISDSSIPVPPLAEQQRIVARVDELMALCDSLEEETAAALEAHQRLVECLLATLVDSTDATDLATNWSRLEAHFNTLFATEASIDALKKTLIELAIRGKLANHNAMEWPTRALGDYVVDVAAGWSPQCNEAPRSEGRWGVLKVSAVTWGKFDPEENKELPSSLAPRPELEVRPGDFLISRANTAELVARSVVVPPNAPDKLMMSDKIIRIRFNDKIEPRYVNLIHASPYARTYYAGVAGGTSSSMKNVSQAKIRALKLPVPDIANQRLAVAKVDELTAFCDALKSRLSEANETQKHLADTIVEKAAA